MDIEVDDAGNPILDQLSEEGFVDLILRITALDETDGHYRFHLAASHRGSEVGLDCLLVKGIQGAFDEEMEFLQENVYREGVRFFRSGEDSDRLISAIHELYGMGERPLRLVDEESFTAIALHQGQLDFDTESVKLKLFGKDGEPLDDTAYYESFFNVDFQGGYVCWNEKDQEYRVPLLQALARSPRPS